MQQMETDGLFSLLDSMRKSAWATVYGKQRRTKELEAEGWDADGVRRHLWHENYITYNEYELPRLAAWRATHFHKKTSTSE